jgi:hypothetical protein
MGPDPRGPCGNPAPLTRAVPTDNNDGRQPKWGRFPWGPCGNPAPLTCRAVTADKTGQGKGGNNRGEGAGLVRTRRGKWGAA